MDKKEITNFTLDGGLLLKNALNLCWLYCDQIAQPKIKQDFEEFYKHTEHLENYYQALTEQAIKIPQLVINRDFKNIK